VAIQVDTVENIIRLHELHQICLGPLLAQLEKVQGDQAANLILHKVVTMIVPQIDAI
jgi:hypothetical protein